MEVSYQTYVVFASVFKAGRGARFEFTFNDFHKAMCEIGFEPIDSGDLVPKKAVGGQPFVSARICGRIKNATKVSDFTQDKWKRRLSSLYGWEANTFLPFS